MLFAEEKPALRILNSCRGSLGTREETRVNEDPAGHLVHPAVNSLTGL